MKKFLAVLSSLVILFLITAHVSASRQKLPVIDGKETVATVSGEPITLDEFNNALYSVHKEASPEGQAASVIDYEGVLNRLVNTKLIVLEAKNIGLDELPEVKEMVDKYSNQTLIGLLRGNYVKSMKVDKDEVDKLYNEAVKEFKIKSLLFDKEADVKKIEEELKAGGNFDDIVQRTIADGTARGTGKGGYLRGQTLMPQVIEIVSKMEIGTVSPVILIKQGYVIFKLEDIRFPENPVAREQARKKAFEHKRNKSLEEYRQTLTKKYVKINEEVLGELDYEISVEEFDKLLKDNRVVAEIKGGQPVTVAELTWVLKDKYFHGIKTAIRDKKLNRIKREYLMDKILQKRAFTKEALKQGIDKSAVYKNMVNKYKNSVIFDLFVKKVVIPDIKLTEKELKKYYNEHIEDYSYSSMIKISGLVFEKKNEAEGALEDLRKGTDFKWLSANAEGQVDKNTEGLLEFSGKFLVTNELPEGVQQAVAGANPGDFRLYESPDNHYYVLFIQDTFASRPLPFEEVISAIKKEVVNKKIQQSLQDWADKLKEYYDVKIYATEF
jgi:hypothetical protein